MQRSLLNRLALFGLLLTLAGCAGGNGLFADPGSIGGKDEGKLVPLAMALNNNPGITLKLNDIDVKVKPGQTFKPTHYADVDRPPEVRQLKKSDIAEWVRLSAGMPITIYEKGFKKPLYGYLIFYPVHNTDKAPKQYKVKLDKAQLQQARKGQKTLSYGEYSYYVASMTSWAMWIANKPLEEDCGC